MCRSSKLASSIVSKFSSYVSDRLISELQHFVLMNNNGNGNEYMEKTVHVNILFHLLVTMELIHMVI